MATSAFKSTTRRTSIGGSERRSLRRSRSHSRFSRSVAAEPDMEADYNRNAPRGNFVNTTRGSPMTPFPDISLDDLALEFFSSSSRNDNESEDLVERKGRREEVARWASDTASSSRRRGRSVSVSRGDVSAPSVSWSKNVPSSDAVSRRRRSLSVARYQISDTESEVGHSHRLSSRAHGKAVMGSKIQVPGMLNPNSLSNRRTGRSRNRIQHSLPHDDYSSQSSTLTDDESKDIRNGNTGSGKMIRSVYAHEKVCCYPRKDIVNGGLYEEMKKEVRYAVEEIRSELSHVKTGSQICGLFLVVLSIIHSFVFLLSTVNRHTVISLLSSQVYLFLVILLQMDKCQQENRAISKAKVDSRTTSRVRRRSCDGNRRMWDTLIEEAERCIEDLTSNVDTTDFSSFDGERSDGGGSSLPGGGHRTSIEMDGVVYPWLQWETTTHDSFSPL
ncbi:hypothetical protein M569_09485, partial [Genlisea aurea]